MIDKKEDKGQLAMIRASFDSELYKTFEEADDSNGVYYMCYLSEGIKVIFPDNSFELVEYSSKKLSNPKSESDVDFFAKKKCCELINKHYGKDICLI